MTEITQEHDFFTWSIQNFVKRVKKFVRKYYIDLSNDLTNKWYDVENSWLHFITYIIEYCFVSLRNSVNKPVE